MPAEVNVAQIAARRTAVVPARTTWSEFPSLWGQLSGEVWACLRANGIDRGCPNVMLYLDDVPHVEVGVILSQPCELTGRVTESELPAGWVATMVHRGPFGEVGTAHDAVIRWCAAEGYATLGPRWEIYGPHRDDPAEQSVEVFWLLEGPPALTPTARTVSKE